jgi:antirestriction protein ArdC
MTTPPNDKLTEAHERMVEAIEALVSGEDWAAMLDVARRFHSYSPGNVLLILSQRPDATRLCGYRAWQALDHQVKKGERGIAILAPCVTRGRPVDESDEEERPALARVLRGFRVVHVFDVSQTEGPDLPDVAPSLLEGAAPAVLWDRLADEVAAKGFSLLREDCSPANGQTDFLRRCVTVRPDLSEAQAAKTLAHELGHVLLHDEEKFHGFGALSCRGLAEVEAESVAYLICSTAGLSTGAYSFPYVARWANGDVALVRSAAERSLSAARAITTALGLTTAPTDPASEAVIARSATRATTPSRRSAAPSRARGLAR